MKNFRKYVQGAIILPFYLIIKIIQVTHLLEILLLPILLILKIRDFIVKRRLKKGEEHVYDTLKYDTGHFIYITGIVGIGKSTMMAGLTHFYSKIFLDMINDDMERCKSILYKVDYINLNKTIQDCRNANIRYEDIYDLYIQGDIFAEFKDKNYDDGININKFNDLIYKYIRAYYRKLDNNFVMSNVEIKSRITNNSSVELKREYLKLKLKNCPIELFNVLSWDEATFGENNSHTSEIKREDDGQSDLMRMVRNMSEGTWYLNFTAQNMTRDVLMYRELATSEINIVDRSIKQNYKCKSLIFKIRLALLKAEESLFIKLKNLDPELFNNRYNKFKEKKFNIRKKLDYINSKAYLIYNVEIDLKGPKDVYCTKFKIPISWCFGAIDTYYFKFILKYIKLEQKLKYYDLHVSDELTWEEKCKIAEDLLSQKKRRKTRAERSEENIKKHAEESNSKKKK